MRQSPSTSWKVPLTRLTIGEEEIEAAVRVLRDGWLTMGAEVEAFEEEFARAIGVRHAVATANATDGLALAYDAVGLEAGDEIAMPALTFVASMNVAIRRGEKPLLIDCTSEDDLTMSVEDLRRKMSPKVRCIVTMPYGGFAPSMDAIMALADEFGIPVIEDACHGILGEYNGRKLGSFGTAGIFSFYGNKNMTTGEGGMLTTNDRALAERVRLMRNHGMTRSSTDHYRGRQNEYDVLVAGHNFRMDEIRAAIGREQLRKVGPANVSRGKCAARIVKRTKELAPGLHFPFQHWPHVSSHHLLVAILPQEVRRDSFCNAMADQGVQTSVHYRPLHRFSHTLGMWPEPPRLPVLESIEKRLVTLPLAPHMSDDEIELIATAAAASLN